MTDRTVWKIPVAVADVQPLAVDHARILAVRAIGADPASDGLAVWVEVEPSDGISDTRTLYLAGTGHPLDPRATTYVGTARTGPFIWHAYTEEPNP